VASLGLVSPGAATDGCLTTFFLVIASESDQVMTLFSCHLLTTLTFPRHLSSVLSKFSHKKLILGRLSLPLEGVTRGGLPPSDATGIS